MKYRYLSLGLLMLAAQAPTNAAPVVNEAVFATDRRLVTPVREQTLWNLNVSTAGSCSDVSAVVSRGTTSFNLLLDTSPVFLNCNLSQLSNNFATTAALLAFAGSTTPWSYKVTDSSGSVSGLFPLIADPEAIPFVQNVSVSDASTTPTISWTLPDLTGFDIDRIRVRVNDVTTGLIFQQNLAANATSYQIAPGVLQFGHSYIYRITLDDLENGLLENRSNTFSAVAVRVPEPGSLALVAIALAGLAGFGQCRRARASAT